MYLYRSVLLKAILRDPHMVQVYVLSQFLGICEGAITLTGLVCEALL